MKVKTVYDGMRGGWMVSRGSISLLMLKSVTRGDGVLWCSFGMAGDDVIFYMNQGTVVMRNEKKLKK